MTNHLKCRRLNASNKIWIFNDTIQTKTFWFALFLCVFHVDIRYRDENRLKFWLIVQKFNKRKCSQRTKREFVVFLLVDSDEFHSVEWCHEKETRSSVRDFIFIIAKIRENKRCHSGKSSWTNDRKTEQKFERILRIDVALMLAKRNLFRKKDVVRFKFRRRKRKFVKFFKKYFRRFVFFSFADRKPMMEVELFVFFSSFLSLNSS